ncbi:MAG: DUF488 domain-containing protein [Syntrophales bacterium]|nr:DUF488 domain-containing protein [Syntrophales bacterium]
MKLYTIGYEGIDIDRFMKCMHFFKISTVVDVRERTSSRKKDFCKNNITNTLMEKGINYINIKELGTPKKMRDQLHKTRNYEKFFNEYRDILKEKTHLLLEISGLIHKNHNVALMCYEKDHNKCHRKIIAEEIKKIGDNGLEVKPMLF